MGPEAAMDLPLHRRFNSLVHASLLIPPTCMLERPIRCSVAAASIQNTAVRWQAHLVSRT
jgi:hypothetical protein